MALGTCRECGWQVAKSAAVCPRCGVKGPVKRTSLAAWAGLAVLSLVLVGMCRAATRSSSGAPAAAVPAPVPAPAPTPAPSAVPLPKLSAAKLRADYKANQVAADAKYQGKRFELSGNVVEVRSGLGDEPQVWLVSALDPVIVKGLTKSFAATLNKNDNMTAKCTIDGVFADMPILDCGGPQ